jgi:hypothetical protein
MHGAVEFNLPIRRPNNRLVGDCIRLAAIRALLAAHRTRLVRASVNVHHVGHWPDYTADTGDALKHRHMIGRLQCLLYLVSLGRMARMRAAVPAKNRFSRYSMTT